METAVLESYYKGMKERAFEQYEGHMRSLLRDVQFVDPQELEEMHHKLMEGGIVTNEKEPLEGIRVMIKGQHPVGGQALHDKEMVVIFDGIEAKRVGYVDSNNRAIELATTENKALVNQSMNNLMKVINEWYSSPLEVTEKDIRDMFDKNWSSELEGLSLVGPDSFRDQFRDKFVTEMESARDSLIEQNGKDRKHSMAKLLVDQQFMKFKVKMDSFLKKNQHLIEKSYFMQKYLSEEEVMSMSVGRKLESIQGVDDMFCKSYTMDLKKQMSDWFDSQSRDNDSRVEKAGSALRNVVKRAVSEYDKKMEPFITEGWHLFRFTDCVDKKHRKLEEVAFEYFRKKTSEGNYPKWLLDEAQTALGTCLLEAFQKGNNANNGYRKRYLAPKYSPPVLGGNKCNKSEGFLWKFLGK
jgi:hypothetical protein